MKRMIFLSLIFLSVLIIDKNKVFASDGVRIEKSTIFSKESKLLAITMPTYRFSFGKATRKIVVRRTITAYSTHRHLTASGRRCRIGIVAANWLPLGAKIMIPKLFGNQIFVVADRMNIRYQSRLDVWMSDKKQALDFGKQSAEIVVLDKGL
jgi:3D (Asp-Asp-Asp) domain-containing protein